MSRIPSHKEADTFRCWPLAPIHALIGAVALWTIPTLVISMMVAVQPLKRTVTPLYHQAAADWWARQNLYVGPAGMNYLPHFAILFSAFHWLPLPLAEVLWRCCAAALLAFGLWRLTKTQFGSNRERPFLLASFLAMPLCLGALRNGQANALFSGLTLLAVAAILDQRWWQAAVLATLATMVKPLGVVLLFLAPAIYAPLRWRLLVAALGMAIFPFLFANPTYVLAQYHAALSNLQACAAVTEHRFADINGLLRTISISLAPPGSKFVRVFAGGLTLALWWQIGNRLRQPLQSLWLYALVATYLMLFNPMTEVNSYVILAPAIGAWAAQILISSEPGMRSLGFALAIIALSMGLLPEILRPFFRNRFALFWHPLMAIFFLAVVTRLIWRSAALAPASKPETLVIEL